MKPIPLAEIQSTLTRTPAAVRALVNAVAPDALLFREGADTWNAVEILCHLAEGEITDWMPRIELILSERRSKRFTPFDREAGFERFQGRPADAVLREFERLRAANLARLASFELGDSDLLRPGEHPELGEVTLGQLLACWVTHDFAHLAQISRVFVRRAGGHIGPWTAYFSLLRGPGGSENTP